MALLLDAIRQFCLAQGVEKTFRVGFSGGLDSHVLLHLLAVLRDDLPLKISAIYVNHGLSPNAEFWSQHCENVCRDLQIDFSTHSVNLELTQSKSSKSPEEIARESRYQLFHRLLDVDDILLTAHHRDDQAETVLLQLLRGAGPKGLAAMPKLRRFANSMHARPLLAFSRAELQKYAEENKLRWIEDESNTNTHFTRNFLRHEVFPLLQKRWPNVSENLARVANHCGAAQQLLDDVLQADLDSLINSEKNTFSITNLLTFDEAKQRMLLRAWLQRLHFPIPSSIKLQQIQRTMLQAREDKLPHVTWGNVEMRRYRDELFVMKQLSSPKVADSYEWDLSQPLKLENIGVLRADCSLINLAVFKTVTVRFRKGGERIQLPDRQHHHSLKNLFQEKGIPPWLRDRVPLIFVGDVLAVVVGYFVAEGFEQLRIDIEKKE